MQTGLISTLEGPAFVRRIGEGPSVVVLHGGPGFDHEYLVEPLRFLAGRRRLVFYDQPGCGSTPAPTGGATPDHTFRHARAVLDAVSPNSPVGVIAHSWGALVLAGAVAQTGGRMPAIGEGLLINPTAINRRDYEAARKTFADRVPLATKLRVFMALFTRSNGTRIMDMLLPYYAPGPGKKGPPPIRLNLETYKAVDRNLGAFDFSGSLAPMARVTIMRGEADFTGLLEIGELVETAARTVTIPDAGHFPFYETPEVFREIALHAFGESRDWPRQDPHGDRALSGEGS